MIKRDLKRIYREHGIKFLSIPILVVLLIASLADQRLDGYLEHKDEAHDLALRLSTNKETLALNERIVRSHDQLEPELLTLQSKWFMEANAEASSRAMQTYVASMLTGLYFDNIDITNERVEAGTTASKLHWQVKMNGVPQQLPRLQSALTGASKLLVVDDLTIRVVEDPKRGGEQLEISMDLTGLHVKPIPPKPEAPAPKKAAKRT